GERLSNYYVFVSQNPFSSTTVAGTLGQAGVTAFYFREPNRCIAIPVRSNGRYIRIQLNKQEYLSLAEVRVFGPTLGSPTINITNPINNQNFPAGANITIAANVQDCDSLINKVEFYRGANLV